MFQTPVRGAEAAAETPEAAPEAAAEEAVAEEATAMEVDEPAQPSESMASVSQEEGAAAVPMEDTDVPMEQQESPGRLLHS